MRCIAVLVGLCLLLVVPALAAQADLRVVDSILGLTTAYRPQAVLVTSRPIAGLDEPSYDGTPLYATIPLNGESFPVVLDRTSDGAVLYAARGADEPLERIDWDHVTASGIRTATVAFAVTYGGTERPEPYTVRLIWDPHTPVVIVYFRDTYRTGTIDLGAQTYRVALVDENTDGRYDDLGADTLYIDVDGDGQLLTTSDSHERYTPSEPFNIAGTVYRVAGVTADGSQLSIVRSDEQVAEKPPLEVGYPAPPFSATDTVGTVIDLAAQRGRVVVLDFWASWCEPCRELLPTIEAIHEDLASAGVSVIGIDVDRDRAAFDAAVTAFDLAYPQIYDGLGGPVADLYRVSALPTTYVIDGDGVIRAKDLRGEALRSEVEAILKQKE